jgi:tyrosyl-tRNA synthetase
MKMSKSVPDSAIFMTDSEEDVKRKIANAYCPEKQIMENPIIEYMKYIIFERFSEVKIERPEKFGGEVSYMRFSELAADFRSGKLHPMDLKSATAKYINELLDPTRKHFLSGKPARLLEFVRSAGVTR